MVSSAVLRRFEWHRPLSPDGREALEHALRDDRLVGDRAVVITQGERNTGLLCVTRGWAARTQFLRDGSRQITAFLMAGDLCNPEALFFENAQQSIVALTPVRTARIPSTILRRLINDHDDVRDALWRAVLLDGLISSAWLTNLGTRESRPRLAHLLMELYTRSKLLGHSINHGCNLPLTQEELADSQGLTAVHVNRVLQWLRRAGLISLHAGNLELLDVPALSELAEFDVALAACTDPEQRKTLSRLLDAERQLLAQALAEKHARPEAS